MYIYIWYIILAVYSPAICYVAIENDPITDDYLFNNDVP